MMFGITCSLCWDRNCNCDPQEVRDHELKQRLKYPDGEKSLINYTNTEPKVAEGDIVIVDNTQYFVQEVINGVGLKTPINDHRGVLTELKEPYKVLQSVLK